MRARSNSSGAVPQRIAHDNLKSAVARILSAASACSLLASWR
jgi:hypothetical protein